MWRSEMGQEINSLEVNKQTDLEGGPPAWVGGDDEDWTQARKELHLGSRGPLWGGEREAPWRESTGAQEPAC